MKTVSVPVLFGITEWMVAPEKYTYLLTNLAPLY